MLTVSYTDAYDLFAVNFANVMIGYVYFPSGSLPTNSDTALKIATVAGTVLGQLGFGFLADHLGRKKVLSQTVIIINIRCTASN
jgi:MFS transporter, PHS family, inorganic phosphate transporter